MKTLKVILISSVLPAIALLSGCDKKSGAANDGSAGAPPASETREYPKFVREWIGANGLEQSDSGNFGYNPKTRQLFEERFRAMEWSNDPAKASFTIELDAQRSLKFRSKPDASNDQQEFLVFWTQPGPTVEGMTSSFVKRSRPIPSAEEALEIMHLFFENDGDIKSAVEWEN